MSLEDTVLLAIDKGQPALWLCEKNTEKQNQRWVWILTSLSLHRDIYKCVFPNNTIAWLFSFLSLLTCRHLIWSDNYRITSVILHAHSLCICVCLQYGSLLVTWPTMTYSSRSMSSKLRAGPWKTARSRAGDSLPCLWFPCQDTASISLWASLIMMGQQRQSQRLSGSESKKHLAPDSDKWICRTANL